MSDPDKLSVCKIRFGDDELQWLRTQARARKLSIAAIVREAVHSLKADRSQARRLLQRQKEFIQLFAQSHQLSAQHTIRCSCCTGACQRPTSL